MTASRQAALSASALLVCALAGCTGGFERVADGAADAADLGSGDGAARDAGRRDGARDAAAADGAPSCAALRRSAGPIQLGFGDADSQRTALAATASRVGAVWERLGSSEHVASVAVLQPDGKIAAKARELDVTDYPPSPALAALGDGFGALRLRDAARPRLIYERLDENGAARKTVELVASPGGNLSGPAIAAGPAGIAVGYTLHGADGQAAIQLGLIDADGATVRALRPLAPGGATRGLALAASSDGLFAAWGEARSGGCWAVVAARLDSSLAFAPPGKLVAFEDAAACHQRAAIAQLGDAALVCAERVAAAADAVLVCRALGRDGTLGAISTTEVSGLAARAPQVVAGGDGYAVLFTARATGIDEVHARRFARGGAPAGEAQRVSEDGVRSFQPAAVWTGEGYLAAWFRYVPITVYFAAFRLGCTDG